MKYYNEETRKIVAEKAIKAVRSVRVLEVVTLVIAVALSLIVSEVALRLFVDAPLTRLYPQVRYDPHPIRRFTLHPDQQAYTYSEKVTIDRNGFRLNGISANGKTKMRIFALGDSFTFGMGVSDNQTWPAQLEKVLNTQLGDGVKVINGGTISYGVFQEMNLFIEGGQSTRPHLVIHGLYWNDYMTNHPPGPNDPPALTKDGYLAWEDDGVSDTFFQHGKQWLYNHSVFAFTIRNILRRLQESQGSGLLGYEAEYQHLLASNTPPENWKIIEDFYAELKARGEKEGFTLYVILFPVIDIVSLPDPAHHPYPRLMREILDRLGIPYLDCFTLWKETGMGREQFLPYNRHLNASGYRIVSEALANSLTANSHKLFLNSLQKTTISSK